MISSSKLADPAMEYSISFASILTACRPPLPARCFMHCGGGQVQGAQYQGLNHDPWQKEMWTSSTRTPLQSQFELISNVYTPWLCSFLLSRSKFLSFVCRCFFGSKKWLRKTMTRSFAQRLARSAFAPGLSELWGWMAAVDTAHEIGMLIAMQNDIYIYIYRIHK